MSYFCVVFLGFLGFPGGVYNCYNLPSTLKLEIVVKFHGSKKANRLDMPVTFAMHKSCSTPAEQACASARWQDSAIARCNTRTARAGDDASQAISGAQRLHSRAAVTGHPALARP